MVYQEKFVAVIMANSKILRENDNSVELPFGTDYSIRLKNLESRKAQVKISIDGEDVMDGHSLILSPNSHVDLEGFMDGRTVRKQFRFIQKTQKIVEHRGDKVDDGIVRVEYCFEKREPEYVPIRYDPWPPLYTWSCNWTYTLPKYPPVVTWDDDTTGGGFQQATYEVTCDTTVGDTTVGDTTSGFVHSGSDFNLCATTQTSFCSTPNADEGITVPGAETLQHFDRGYIGSTDQPHVITIRLKGTTRSGAVVEKAVGTKDKAKCPTCGKTWNAKQKFCGNCGTNLSD
jgi:hypothetical protein